MKVTNEKLLLGWYGDVLQLDVFEEILLYLLQLNNDFV